MARANRLRRTDGGIFHVTHRCHNQTFLLKFARDRDAYRTYLRTHLNQFDVSILDYCVTSNHIHLLIDSPDRQEVSRFMRAVEGEYARYYNRRKNRANAFWGDNYHATLVEGGSYLWRCLCYIELNMVRCGVVKHPREWPWVGFNEIMGLHRRNRVIDLKQLCWRLRTDDIHDLRRNLEASLAERISQAELKRESFWTESLVVGSSSFVEQMRPGEVSRLKVKAHETAKDLWTLREVPVSYGTINDPENRPISPNST
jgi:putative transposase